LGLSIGGINSDASKPDNNLRRYITLRNSDGPNAVVSEWSTDERISLVKQSEQDV